MRRLLSVMLLMIPVALFFGCNSSTSPSKPASSATSGGGFKDKAAGHTASDSVPNVPPPPSK